MGNSESMFSWFSIWKKDVHPKHWHRRRNYTVSKPQDVSTAEPGYNDIGLLDTSSITSDYSALPIHSPQLIVTLYSLVITTFFIMPKNIHLPSWCARVRLYLIFFCCAWNMLGASLSCLIKHDATKKEDNLIYVVGICFIPFASFTSTWITLRCCSTAYFWTKQPWSYLESFR